MTKKITKLMLNGQEYEIREYQAGGDVPTGSFDFSDGTWDVTKIADTFASKSGNTNFITGSGYTSDSTSSNMAWNVTDNGNNYHKITIKANGYIPTGWYAQSFGITNNISDLGAGGITARMQDYSSTSSRGKQFYRLETQLATTQAFYGGAWYEKIMTYDWSTGEYLFTINGDTIFSGNDSGYSSVASAYQGTLYIYCGLERGGAVNSCFWKTVERKLE